MKMLVRPKTVCLVLIPLLFWAAQTVGKESVLPAGLTIEDAFKPGIGDPVGRIGKVGGKAVIVHADQNIGYRAKKDLPIFQDDTIITLKEGRIELLLSDGSKMTLASSTKLIISRHVYNTNFKTRSSFVEMTFGKVRFVVRKLTGFKQSKFNIKTKTAILGVRGSDFVVFADDEMTEIVTNEGTRLDAVGLVNINKSIRMGPLNRVVIRKDRLPSKPKTIRPRKFESLVREFEIAPDGKGWAPPLKDESKKQTGKTPEYSSPEGSDETKSGDQTAASGKPDEKKPGTVAGKAGAVIVSEDELVNPDDLAEPEAMEEIPVPAISGDFNILEREEEMATEQEEIREEQNEALKPLAIPEIPNGE